MYQLILDGLKNDLRSLVEQDKASFPFTPYSTNPYNAMSAMQKAIRRGDCAVALRAASALLKINPTALWRRLGVTAFEDITIADPTLLGHVSLCVDAKKFRAELGGDWKVATHLISRMCESSKDRSPDDLVDQLMYDPELEDHRWRIAELSFQERLNLIFETDRIDLKALAVWMSFGSNRVVGENIPEVTGDPTALFDCMIDHGLSPTNVEIARIGAKKTGEVLPAFFPVLYEASYKQEQYVKDDELPPICFVNEIPSYVFDLHTRDGNSCFREFIRRSPEMRAFLLSCDIPKHAWSRTVGKITFRVESGLLINRLCWRTGQELRRLGDTLGGGINPKMALEGLELMNQSIPLLNEVRMELIGGRS
ncbi:hypothetical protein [Kiloniella sp.]|uniref:hypothetical protein n=1 Tax=Kiloniella sp. TaxID=1938587 RepID=UPI003A90006C